MAEFFYLTPISVSLLKPLLRAIGVIPLESQTFLYLLSNFFLKIMVCEDISISKPLLQVKDEHERRLLLKSKIFENSTVLALFP